jgi:hypothetical protein
MKKMQKKDFNALCLMKPEEDSVIGGAIGSMPYIESEDPVKSADDKAYMQSRGYNKGGSVSRGVGKAIRGTKFKGVF